MIRRTFVGALAIAAALSTGCMTEHSYPAGYFGDAYDDTIGEVFGSVGQLEGIENQFLRPGAVVDWLGGAPPEMTVQRWGSDIYANAVAQHPSGRVYLDISVTNFERMEPGRPYTVQLRGTGYTQEGDFVYADASETTDEPYISVYACPEGLDFGYVGQSGNAEEVTVILEPGSTEASPRFTFSATADNEEQALFLDGWFRGEPTEEVGW